MNEPKLPEYLTEHEDGSVSVRFHKKVSLAGVEVDEVRLRELTLEDQLAASKAAGGDGGVMTDVHMLCLIGEGLSPPEVTKLPRRVFSRLQDALRLFFV